MILSRPYIGQIIDKKNPNVLIYPFLILFAIGMISMAITQSMTMVIVSGVILGLSYGSIFPCFQTLTVQTSPKEKSGAAMATFFLFYDLGFGLGALILAKITALYDYSSMYFIISLIIFGMMVCYYLFRKYNLVTERTL